jgi:transmembrane sensor
VIQEADLLRFIEGECSPEEAATIQAWVAADPKRGELLEELRAVWRLTGASTGASTGANTRRWNVESARQRLLRARRALGVSLDGRRTAPAAAVPAWSSRRTVPGASVRSSWRSATSMRIAAAAGLMIAGALLWYLRPFETPYREYATARGQRATLSLADGSRVLLSVDTRLRVPREYGDAERAVELEGEAYFIVRHDPRRPFLVRTRYGTAEDLGTEFGVRAYHEEPYLQVVVASGSVALRRPNGAADTVMLMLRPGDRGVLDSRGGATQTRGVALEHYVAWTGGRLVFDDAPLGSVVAELERWYGLDIHLSDSSLVGERVTIAFTTESPDEALSALSKVLNVGVTRAGRSIRLGSARSR